MTAQHYKNILGAGLVLIMFGSVGCKKSSNDNSQSVAARSARQSVAPAITTNTVNPMTGQNYTSAATAPVTTETANSTAFQAALKSLVSGQMDPQFLGYASPTDGVMLRAHVEIDAQGRVVPQNSRLSLEIRDEYTNQSDSSGNRIPPVTMTLPASSGYAYNGQIQLVFQDSVGRIEIYGTFQSGGIVNGQLWFANTKKWDGSSAATSLIGLGNFQVQTCGFFKCQ
jgi:hypothetical protein